MSRPDPDPACHVDPDPTFKLDADPDPSFQIKAQNLEKVLKQAYVPYVLASHLKIDADPDSDPANHFDADRDPACHVDTNPDPACHINPDPDPTFNFNADPDPSFQVKADNQGWAKLVSNLTFSKRKAMVFFEN